MAAKKLKNIKEEFDPKEIGIDEGDLEADELDKILELASEIDEEEELEKKDAVTEEEEELKTEEDDLEKKDAVTEEEDLEKKDAVTEEEEDDLEKKKELVAENDYKDDEKIVGEEDSDEDILKKLEEEDEEEKKASQASSDAAVISAESLDKIFEGQNLTKEFRSKVAGIFEAAVNLKVKSLKENVSKNALKVIHEQRTKNFNRLVGSVDRYFRHAAKQWFGENRIAIVDGITLELAEGAVGSVKGFLSKYNVRVPRSRENLVEKLSVANININNKLNKALKNNISLHETVEKLVKEKYINSMAEGLSGTDKEKFVTLAEEVSFIDTKSYRTKLKGIREGLFTESKKSSVDFASKMLLENVKKEESTKEVTPQMDAYLRNLK